MHNQVVSHDDWLKARVALLKEEKELTRRSDELARRRQELPWVRIDKAYRFETDEGSASLDGPVQRTLAAPRLSLHVRGRLQGGVSVLLVDRGRVQRLRRPPGESRRHALGGVAGPAREASGVQAADGVDLSLGVLARRRLQHRLHRLDHRAATARGGVEYNYQRGGHVLDAKQVPEPVARFAASCGTDAATFMRERPGMSAFVLEDGVVYHTYSTYARGLDGLWGMYQWLDRAPKGRSEKGVWWRRHDEYGEGPAAVRGATV